MSIEARNDLVIILAVLAVFGAGVVVGLVAAVKMMNKKAAG